MLKKTTWITLLTALWISSCASPPVGITDTITFYPDNDVAAKWGVFEYYRQYSSDVEPSEIVTIKLPNGEQLTGQITFIQQGQSGVSYDYWDDVNIGYGNWGGWYGGFSFSPSPSYYNVQNDTGLLQIDAFGKQTRLNCEGEYNRRKGLGVLSCDLSNGMKYKGHIRQYTAELPATGI